MSPNSNDTEGRRDTLRLDLSDCRCCPRNCGADRLAGPLGSCGIGAAAEVASICVHRGEEPVISGRRGICNIFFRSCNLRCIYCQNYQISRADGDPAELIGTGQIVDAVDQLLARGLKAVGFVSPSHFLPQVIELIGRFEQRRPRPRLVFNTNAYDRADLLRELEGRIDIYLPDLKYMDEKLGRELSGVPRYPETATLAIKEMFRQMGSSLLLDDEDEAVRGLIIRHLVLPGYVENSKAVLRWIASELSPSVHISLMSQYYPTPEVKDHPSLGRTLHPEEYAEVLAEFDRLGFYRGWVQELESQHHYRPDFNRDHPFESPGGGVGP